jgi:glucosamine kinase
MPGMPGPTAANANAANPRAGAAAFLGLDAGGTATRWALADGTGVVFARGEAPPLSGLMLLDAPGRAALVAALGALKSGLAAATPMPPAALWAGITGFDAAQSAALAIELSNSLGVEARCVVLASDIELACRAAFAPGAGIVVYAGTGSIAAHLAADGQLHRAGGRGAVLDDAGGGHWIAREALKRVWRAEDHAPGAWRQSPLAQALFDALGGSDWSTTRGFVYGASRGELGRLALAVAHAAESDPAALALLHEAGAELARLALALRQRLGPLPVALAGRVFALHPGIEAALRGALPGADIQRSDESVDGSAHDIAARLAASTSKKENP